MKERSFILNIREREYVKDVMEREELTQNNVQLVKEKELFKN